MRLIGGSSFLKCFSLIVLTSTAHAVTFFDDFSGPNMSADWSASYPNSFFGTGFGPIQYQGEPNHVFETVDGSSVLRMNGLLSVRQRWGWTSSATFPSKEFRYEARFNTLNQVAGVSIDGFIELSILDAATPTRIDSVNLFGSASSTQRYFNADSNIDPSANNYTMNYENNTWYRLIIEGSAAEDIRGYVTNDAGVELFGATFSHTTDAFPAGIKLGLSQWMGLATDAPVDVAVDWVRFEAVPEPAGVVLVGLVAALSAVVRRRSLG